MEDMRIDTIENCIQIVTTKDNDNANIDLVKEREDEFGEEIKQNRKEEEMADEDSLGLTEEESKVKIENSNLDDNEEDVEQKKNYFVNEMNLEELNEHLELDELNKSDDFQIETSDEDSIGLSKEQRDLFQRIKEKDESIGEESIEDLVFEQNAKVKKRQKRKT